VHWLDQLWTFWTGQAGRSPMLTFRV